MNHTAALHFSIHLEKPRHKLREGEDRTYPELGSYLMSKREGGMSRGVCRRKVIRNRDLDCRPQGKGWPREKVGDL